MAASPAVRLQHLTKRYGAVLAVDDAGPGRAARRGLRLPRPQRRRQVHHHPAAARVGPAHRRHAHGLRHRAPDVRRGAPAAGPRAGRRGAVAASSPAPSSWSCWAGIGPGVDERLPRRARRALRARPVDRPARTYSTGNRQKVALVAAFATRAPLLVLDEPTSGLDPLMEREFRRACAEARDARADGVPQLPPARRGRGGVRPGRHPARRPAGRGRRPAGPARPAPHRGGPSPVPTATASRPPAGPARRRRGAAGAGHGRVRFTLTGAPGPGAAAPSRPATSLRAGGPRAQLEEIFLDYYGQEPR